MKNYSRASKAGHLAGRWLIAILVIPAFILSLHLGPDPERTPFIPTARANSVYFNLSSGNLNFNVQAGNVNQITTNDDWSAVNSV